MEHKHLTSVLDISFQPISHCQYIRTRYHNEIYKPGNNNRELPKRVWNGASGTRTRNRLRKSVSIIAKVFSHVNSQ